MREHLYRVPVFYMDKTENLIHVDFVRQLLKLVKIELGLDN